MKVIDATFMIIFAFIIASLGLYLPIPSGFKFIFYFVAILFISLFVLLSLHGISD